MNDTAADVLARLVALKDGPRNDAYHAAKETAWQDARNVLARLSKCHFCGRLNPPDETYTRTDGTTYCLRTHRDHTWVRI